jgi:predicted RNA binding protein YcfA (HicA-like mRNA interferase family)
MFKIPRDLSGLELAGLLKKYGFEITRQTGSHIRLTSKFTGVEHHMTIPQHETIKIGMLSNKISDLAVYLKLDKNRLIDELF